MRRYQLWSRRGVVRSGVSIVVALALLLPVSPGASAVVDVPVGGPAGPVAQTEAGRESHTITLLTGDVVRVSGKDKDQSASFETPSEDGQIVHAGDELYAFPGRALPLLAAGKLDLRLFDVSRLVRDGYSDDKVKSLPVIVEYSSAAGVAAASDGTGLAGASVVQRFESISGVAATVEHGKAREFFDSLTQPGASAQAAAGIAKVWLDGKVQALDDVSRVTIGADKAWAAGFEGQGASVAVLDTGVDSAHADLAGSVVEARDFVPAAFPGGDSPTDRYGHGTHVASIIAGSGAKSGGKYAGVGPKAKLYNGKVLTDGGSGLDSWIIAGMEWAASKAKVVNMSLGGCCSDGTDPLAHALDSISQRTGTLFVVAAGNNGQYGARTVNTPGVAASALTVAATKRDGSAVDYYSSQGLRIGDDGLKPEIAAPGTDIWAASANNDNNAICKARPTACDGKGYMRISGTSMATPHVAGTAAILAGQHPTWSGQQLKDALTSTAKPTKDPVAKQGAGLVDVGKAVTQAVHASGVLDLGVAKANPQPGDRLTGTITYTNDGTTPLALDLAASGFASTYNPAVDKWTPPAGALTLQPAKVSVPAGGTATATINIQASAVPAPQAGVADPRMLAGRVTATSVGGPTVSTTVSFGRDIPRYPLKVDGMLKDGSKPHPASYVIACGRGCWLGYPFATDGTGGKWFSLGFGAPDIRRELPAGRYSLDGVWYSPHWGQSIPFTGFDTQLDKSQQITVDGRKAQLLDVVSERPTVNDQTQVRTGALESWYGPGYPPYLLIGPSASNYAVATRRAPVPLKLGTTEHHPLTVNAELSRATGVRGDPWFWRLGLRRELPSSGEVTLVDVGDATPAALAGKDLRGKVALVREAAKTHRLIDDEVAAVANAGGTGVVLAVADDVEIRYSFADQPIWSTVISHADGDKLAGLMGGEPLSLHAEADRSYLYDLTFAGTLPRPSLTFEVRNKDLATINASYHDSEPGSTDPRAHWGRESSEDDLSADFWYRQGGMPLPTQRTEYVSPGARHYRNVSVGGRYSWFMRTPVLAAGQTVDLGPGGLAPLVPGQWGDKPLITNNYNRVWFDAHASGKAYGGDDGDFLGWKQNKVLGVSSSTGDVGFPVLDYEPEDWPWCPPDLCSPKNAGPTGSTFRTQMFAGDTRVCDEPYLLLNGQSRTGKTCWISKPGQYRVVADVTQKVLPTSTRTSTQWTLNIDRLNTDPKKAADVPLVLADYRLPVGLDGSGPAEDHKVRVHVGYQRGGPVAAASWAVKAWATFDDGATWRPVYDDEVGSGGWFTPEIGLPERHNGYVGLRIQADDGKGNTIDQTVIRAYALTPGK